MCTGYVDYTHFTPHRPHFVTSMGIASVRELSDHHQKASTKTAAGFLRERHICTIPSSSDRGHRYTRQKDV